MRQLRDARARARCRQDALFRVFGFRATASSAAASLLGLARRLGRCAKLLAPGGKQTIAGTAGSEENDVIRHPGERLQSRELVLVDSLDDRDGIVNILGDARNDLFMVDVAASVRHGFPQV